MKSLFLTIIGIALLGSGCSLKTSSGGGAPSNLMSREESSFEDPAITGPNVEGHWDSNCIEVGLSTYRNVALEFTGGAFTYTNRLYSDSNCQNLSESPTVHAGNFQFTKALSDGSYNIDYNYKDCAVLYKWREQLLMVQEDSLYISDFTFGMPVLNMNLRFKRRDSQGTLPVAGLAPVPSFATCTDFSGTYQMNTDYFEIKQSGCNQVVITDLPSYFNPTPVSVTYVTDGQVRKLNYNDTVSYFNQSGSFVVRRLNSSSEIVDRVYSLQAQPCNLVNPDGGMYLTKETYIAGQSQSSSCVFWKNTKGKIGGVK